MASSSVDPSGSFAFLIQRRCSQASRLSVSQDGTTCPEAWWAQKRPGHGR